MKKRLNIQYALAIVTALFFSTPLLAQPTIPDISGVKEIHIDLACNATLIQGEKASVAITGDDDALEDVYVKLKGDVLVIGNDRHHQHKNDVKVSITIPELKKLSIGGAVDITTPTQVKFDNFELEVSGVADLDIKLLSKMLNLEASGVISGEIIGETKDLKMEISGVGKIDASGFKAENCEIEVSGVAKADVYVTEKLDASVSGMGNIHYLGRPIINRSTSGFGSISRLN